MIKSFANKLAEDLYDGDVSKETRRFPNELRSVAARKLSALDYATTPEDLMYPPGNRLEKLKGNRKNKYSIRINDQWRIVFGWENGQPVDVEVTDYH